ncbi:hypothetical protein [Priestia megaterium]|uniref:hypothetical protein n=1 Tax=Priestia megaterium TaxID=1404 RepID=UPI001FB5017F|nr:hypothetical protein [Priestia megaterium]
MTEQVYSEIERVIKQSGTPVKTQIKNVSPGMLKGKKKFLLVSGVLKQYVIGICAEAYGSYLCVDIYLTKEPNFLDNIRGALTWVGSKNATMASQVVHSVNLDVFNSQELDNFWGTTSASVEEALQSLGLKGNQRGFGNIA